MTARVIRKARSSSSTDHLIILSRREADEKLVNKGVCCLHVKQSSSPKKSTRRSCSLSFFLYSTNQGLFNQIMQSIEAFETRPIGGNFDTQLMMHALVDYSFVHNLKRRSFAYTNRVINFSHSHTRMFSALFPLVLSVAVPAICLLTLDQAYPARPACQ